MTTRHRNRSLASPRGSRTEESSALLPDAAWCITPIGSYLKLSLPTAFDRLFKDGILVDRRNDTPMEMDGYSAYLALKAIEMRSGRDFRQEKAALFRATVARLETSPPFAHGAWTGAADEIHLRFVSAAIKLIAEATRDGLIGDSGALERGLRLLLSFRSPLGPGIWFLHDSFESPTASAPYPQRRSALSVWHADAQNNLVLNTHLDTLSTAIKALPLLSNAYRGEVEGLIGQGISALEFVLARRSRLWNWLAPLDALVRTCALQLFRMGPASHRLGRKAMWHVLGARARIRAAHPQFVMPDGYVERDMKLSGGTPSYQLVNVYDLLRLSHCLRTIHPSLATRLAELGAMGLQHAVESSFRHWVRAEAKTSGVTILLCEAMLLHLALSREDRLKADWLSLYCDIRDHNPPSPALLGYDPFVVGSGERSTIDPMIDVAELKDGRRIEIDVLARSQRWL